MGTFDCTLYTSTTTRWVLCTHPDKYSGRQRKKIGRESHIKPTFDWEGIEKDSLSANIHIYNIRICLQLFEIVSYQDGQSPLSTKYQRRLNSRVERVRVENIRAEECLGGSPPELYQQEHVRWYQSHPSWIWNNDNLSTCGHMLFIQNLSMTVNQ